MDFKDAHIPDDFLTSTDEVYDKIQRRKAVQEDFMYESRSRLEKKESRLKALRGIEDTRADYLNVLSDLSKVENVDVNKALENTVKRIDDISTNLKGLTDYTVSNKYMNDVPMQLRLKGDLTAFETVVLKDLNDIKTTLGMFHKKIAPSFDKLFASRRRLEKIVDNLLVYSKEIDRYSQYQSELLRDASHVVNADRIKEEKQRRMVMSTIGKPVLPTIAD
jgi:hypothetical protein